MGQSSYKNIFLGILTIFIVMIMLAIGYGLITVYVFNWYPNSQWYEVAFIAGYIQLAICIAALGNYAIVAYAFSDRK
jgi:hypothetical protein